MNAQIEFALVAIYTIHFFIMLSFFLIFLTKRNQEIKNEILPTVTVFVPFFNENHEVLLKTLAHIDAQQYDKQIQVIIVDDGSINNTKYYVKKWLQSDRNHIYDFIVRSENGGSKGNVLDFILNKNIATGDAYIIIDSDTFIEPNGVLELSKKLWSDPNYAAVCGYITPNNYRGSFIGKLQHFEHIGFFGAIRSVQDHLGVVPVLAGAFVAHRASVINSIGGWDEWLVEDIAWCWKAISNNYRTGYSSKAKAKTQCPTTINDLWKQRRRWSRGRVEAFCISWKVSIRSGIMCTPWFVFTSTQYLLPPSLILLPVMIYYGVWLPILLSVLGVFMYAVMLNKYADEYDSYFKIKFLKLLQIPFYSLILEMIIWAPNLAGYFDEVTGKKKRWLTR